MLIVFELSEMYIVIKTTETNMEFFFFLKKTRNEKLIIYNEKLVIMYLSVSK